MKTGGGVQIPWSSSLLLSANFMTTEYKDAKRRINKLFQLGDTLYFSDIADILGIDLRLVVQVCEQLSKEGKIFQQGDKT